MIQMLEIALTNGCPGAVARQDTFVVPAKSRGMA